MQENIRIYQGCEGGVKRICPEDHQLTSLGLPSEGQIFLSQLTQIMDSFSCTPLYMAFLFLRRAPRCF